MSAIEAPVLRIMIPEGAWVHHAVTSREEALKVECPTCRVVPGSPCVEPDSRAARKALHVARHSLAIGRGARIRFIGGVRVFHADEEANAA